MEKEGLWVLLEHERRHQAYLSHLSPENNNESFESLERDLKMAVAIFGDLEANYVEPENEE